MRVAIIDIGSNSTRCLIADVERSADGRSLAEVARFSRVTRLARGLETAGCLSHEAIGDVASVVDDYLAAAAEHQAERTVAYATSAVRDASNGDAFRAELRERFALEARTIDGSEEARLTWAGARHGSSAADVPTLVVDIGGGSTELITGLDEPGFHASLQLGVVRQSERHLQSDPPSGSELEELADDVRRILDAGLAGREGISVERGIAVAGTPASLAGIQLAKLGNDRFSRVEGYVLSLSAVQAALSRLASLPLAERAELPGLERDRAPMIVAGTVILINVMRLFGLAEISVSRRDILHGAALATVADDDEGERGGE